MQGHFAYVAKNDNTQRALLRTMVSPCWLSICDKILP